MDSSYFCKRKIEQGAAPGSLLSANFRGLLFKIPYKNGMKFLKNMKTVFDISGRGVIP